MKMKIWSITGSVRCADGATQQHWHFTATKKEALRYIREAKDNYDGVELEAQPYAINPGAKGTAQALTDFIEWTCINEG